MSATGRPVGDLPQVIPQNYTGLTGGSATYNGTPNVVTPAAGVVNVGKVPLAPWLAQHQNWLEGQILARLDHADLAELTFTEPNGDIRGVLDTTSGVSAGSAVRGLTFAPFIPGSPLYAVLNSGDVWVSTDGGYHWTSAESGATRTYEGICHLDASLLTIYSTTTPDKRLGFYTGVGGWTSQALADITTLSSCIVPDPDRSLVFVGGLRTTGSDPCVWRADCTGASPVVTQLSRAGTQAVEHVAVSPAGRYVAAGSTESHKWVDGDTVLTAGGAIVAGANTTKGLCYEGGTGRFLAVFDDGTNGGCRTSSDGAAWSNPGSAGLTGVTFRSGSLVCRGSLVLAGVEFGGVDYLAVSRDAGVSWELMANPLKRVSGAGAFHLDRIAQVQNRIMILGYRASGAAAWGASLRCGRGR